MQGTRGAIECAFHLADGLITCSKNDEGKVSTIDRVLAVWDKGCVELYYQLGEYAELCHQLYEEGYAACESGSPGVYDYEVSYVFGGWFGSYVLAHTTAPSREDGETELRRLAEEFWADQTR
jgi:hypothetical protein